MENMKNKAFTLAEVLITLGVIGIIAALTMPVLIGKYQKRQTVVRLKKTYAVLAQAAEMSKAFNGEDWEISDMSIIDSLNKYIFPYLKYDKVCKKSDTNCFAETFYMLNGRPLGEESDAHVFVTLNDGVVIKFSQAGKVHFGTKVDINGIKGPNILGKDIFELFITPQKVVPSCPNTKTGINTTDLSECSREASMNHPSYGCNKSASGAYCTHVIMTDGWEIKDDYPW